MTAGCEKNKGRNIGQQSLTGAGVLRYVMRRIMQ